MEDPHVRKKKGRFIKANDPIRHAMSITNFNLLDICDTKITYADNIDANIIHAKLHLNEDINRGVRLSSEIESIFEPSEYRPVIKPLDFTQEWIKQRKRMNSRQSRLDDDDEVDVEMENIAKKLRKKFSNKLKKQEIASEELEVKRIGSQLDFEEEIDEFLESIESSGPVEKIPEISINNEVEGESFVPLDELSTHSTEDVQDETMKSIGSAINEIATPTSDMPSTILEDNNVDFKVEETDDGDTFVPLMPDSTGGIQDTPPSVNHEERQIAFEEARSRGYEDGYKDGEEKAMILIQQKVSEIVDEFGKIMDEFEGMKSSILQSSQDNFRKVCQTMMESLLQKEFRMNPKSFETILNRAILEAVPDDEFRVLVSQNTFENIKDDIDQSLLEKIKVDSNMQEGNFKIESNLSVVDGNISQIIEDLLDQADLELFDSSSDNKAG